jgi:hypothetical protein
MHLKLTSLDLNALVHLHHLLSSRWVKNIHCAVGAHLLANPAATKQQTIQFRDRINQEVGNLFPMKRGHALHTCNWNMILTIN